MSEEIDQQAEGTFNVVAFVILIGLALICSGSWWKLFKWLWFN